MNNDQINIIKIARDTMSKIRWKFNSQEEVTAIFKTQSEQLENLNEIHQAGFLPKDLKLEDAKKKIRPYWVVFFDFEPEAEIDNNMMMLEIDDETGEPYEIRHKQARFKILKNDKGGYYTELI